MGRAPRADPDDGWHHVMNRGIARQPVFFTAKDGEEFEHLLATGSSRFDVELHAYCLMTNHFHLLLHCPRGGLSGFMQLVGARYTRELNERRHQDGPIFRGRFRSVHISDDRQLAAVGRYIHRNPLDIRPQVELADYRWSSYRHYCSPGGRPGWLHTNALSPGGAQAYRALVEGSADLIASVRWAVDTAIEELAADDGSPAGFGRSVATAMLDLAPSTRLDEIERWLGFPSMSARRNARYRARQRYDDDPVLRAVVHRALDLLGAAPVRASRSVSDTDRDGLAVP
jgi:REP element-mobilizing transposase RayT